MASMDWKAFLTQWSREIIEAHGDDLPSEVVSAGWLGAAPATAEEIAEAERRLGLSLPPSYRAFLQLSNGWLDTGIYDEELSRVDEINWLAQTEPDILEAWMQEADEEGDYTSEEYHAYGDAQDETIIPKQYLRELLQISSTGDELLLLNPKVVNAEGEWEAWFLADWIPGAYRYPSFQALMESIYQDFNDSLNALYPYDETEALAPQLDRLALELDETATSFETAEAMPQGLPVDMSSFTKSTAEVLRQSAQQVRELMTAAGSSEADDVLDKLEALAESWDSQAADQQEKLSGFASMEALQDMLSNPGAALGNLDKMMSAVGDAGKVQGYAQAADIVWWFLGDEEYDEDDYDDEDEYEDYDDYEDEDDD